MHLKLSEQELIRLGNRIEEDFHGALADHASRIERFRRYYQLWRNRVDPPAAGEKDKPNFQVPLIQWQVFTAWSHNMQSLFGEDAEIVAKPTGPSDQRTVGKVGKFLTWRMFDSMEMVTPLSIFEFRKLLCGRTHAYTPWVRDTYQTDKGEETWYEGPGFFPMRPDDLIVPAEDAQTIHDFSFVIRKHRASPQELLDGEREGKYVDIKEDFQRIFLHAQQKRTREPIGDDIKREEDLSEGVEREGSQAKGASLQVWEWFGRWRLPKGSKDPSNVGIEGRALDEVELLVRYLPDMKKVIGVLNLMDLYPKMRFRRPFVESSLVKDGSYWAMGFGEMLESIQDETTANHRMFTQAGWLSVGPLIIYRPGSGFDPKTFRYEPMMAIPSESPGDLQIVQTKANLEYSVLKDQALRGYAEMVTGRSEANMGRMADRPNQPRTASGQIALLEQGNIRASLDVLSMREDVGKIAQRIWLLDSQFAGEDVFFRVTEEDAKGLFDVRKGGSLMTAEERGGRYDFKIKFATSYWSREANKERTLARYQIDMQNPLIIQNPRALWLITKEVHRALGDENFSQIMPEPPDLGLPKNPREEWNLALQGEDFEVHPMDNDDLHLMDHMRRLEDAQENPRRDDDAMNRMGRHVIDQKQQKKQKILMSALTQELTRSLAANTAAPEGGGINLRTPIPMPLQNIQDMLAGMGQGLMPGQQGVPPAPAPGGNQP